MRTTRHAPWSPPEFRLNGDIHGDACHVLFVSQSSDVERLQAAVKGTGIPDAARVVTLAVATQFHGQRDRLLLDRQDSTAGLARIVLTGLGHAREGSFTERLRRAASVAVRAARSDGAVNVVLHVPQGEESDTCRMTEAVALGARQGLWMFTSYRTVPNFALREVRVVSDGGQDLSPGSLRQALVIADAIDRCRYWQALGSNDKTPELLARLAIEQGNLLGFHIEVLDETALRALGAGAILGVGQGSVNPPRVVIARHCPSRAVSAPVIAYVGKGITFDSGGLSLKDATRMVDMKYDMSGAASILAALGAVSALGETTPVIGILMLAENMPSGSAQRPGDVIRSLGGLTVEVSNTDAEGRLVLADGIALARRLGATHIVDVATLTGAAMVALGPGYGALMGSDEMTAFVSLAAARSDERLWRLPIDHPSYAQAMQSDVADIRNVGGDHGGAVKAGHFLSRFAGPVPWAHIDMGSLAWAREANPASDRGPLGPVVETLTRLPKYVGTAADS